MNLRNEPTLFLVVAACVSVVLYWFCLVQPFSLFDFQPVPALRALDDWTEGNPALRLRMATGVAALFAIYFLVYKRTVALEATGNVLLLTGLALLLPLPLVFLQPISSTDLYDYLAEGWVLGTQKANILVTIPARYPDNPFLPYSSWANELAHPYGPLWFLLAAIPSFLGVNEVRDAVLLLKVLLVLFHLATVLVLSRALLRFSPSGAASGIVLYAWNPFVLYNLIGDGHNDAVMLFFLALALWFAAVNRPVGILPAMTLGMLVKPLLIVLLPTFLWFTIATQERRARWRIAILGATLSALLLIAFYAPFWEGLGTFQVFSNVADRIAHGAAVLPWLVLKNTLKALPAGFIADPYATSKLVISVLGLLFLAGVWIAIVRRSSWTWHSLMVVAFVSLFAFLLRSFWFFPWYSIGLILLAPFLQCSLMRGTAMTLSGTALLGVFLQFWVLETSKTRWYGLNDAILILVVWPLPFTLWVMALRQWFRAKPSQPRIRSMALP